MCPYEDILGISNVELHKQVMGVPILDLIATIVLSETIVFLFKTGRIITFFSVFFTWIVLHRMFCVRTTLDTFLFP